MGLQLHHILIFFFAATWILPQYYAVGPDTDQTSFLLVNASKSLSRKMPDNLFGVFFEEINHAGAGGLWAELVSNRGFEAGGPNTPSIIAPWGILGDESSLIVSTDRSSLFDRNKVALRMDVLCDIEGANKCPSGGVGIYNPGYWGMNIEQGKAYQVVLFVRSLGSINISVSLTGANGLQTLAYRNIVADDVSKWTKVEFKLDALETDRNARLQLTTLRKGVVWFDQVSVMPLDTYKGHGFRKDLFSMVQDLRPGFLRFPGGCFVEGDWLRNAFRWKETIGPWEERPGHWGDVWNYWTDDGMGHLEFLQLAEDLGALPIWVFNNGVSHHESVNPSAIEPFIQEILDGLEFAKGGANSTWGSVRAKLGHPEPFDVRYVAIGNEDCDKPYYKENYLKFYYAIRNAYPDINMISNCDGSVTPLGQPAQLYDFHIYATASEIVKQSSKFDNSTRVGPKAFVSEYAVWKTDAGTGSLLAALTEACFLIGVERNSDLVEFASYAPLFVNKNDRTWNPDAIVFDSSQVYGTPSYWMQHFFRESNGATFLSSTLQSSSSSLNASAIAWQSPLDKKTFLRVKVVNRGSNATSLTISIRGLQGSIEVGGSSKIVLTSSNVMDENSFSNPNKVVPVKSVLDNAGEDMTVTLQPHSLTAFDLSIRGNLDDDKIKMVNIEEAASNALISDVAQFSSS